MIHLTLQQLSAYLDGELTDASTELVRRHLSECDACTGRFARIESQEEILARVLVDEPGDAFFKDLSDSIAAAVDPGSRPGISGAKTGARARDSKPTKAGARKKAATREKVGTPPKPVETVAPPPALVAPTSVVPVAAPIPVPPAAPVAVAHVPNPPAVVEPPPVAQPAPVDRPARPEPRGRRAEDRAAAQSQAKSSPIGSWIAAAVILVSVASTGLVLYKRNTTAPPQPAPSDHAAVAPETAQPSLEPETTAETPSADGPPAVAPEETPAPEPTAPEPELAAVEIAKPDPPAPVKPKTAARRPASSPSPAPAPVEHLVDRAPQNIVPVRTFITETTSGTDEYPAPAPAPGLNARDSSLAAQAAAAQAAATRTHLLDDAKKSSLRAAESRTADAFDDAASAWERALPSLQGSPEDLAVARREAAQARYQAWVGAPTPSRKTAAITAARAYLLYAPPGPERDQAWTWLGRLKQ